MAQSASLESRVPVLHFFDGFRTSHEMAKILPIGDDVIRSMLKPEPVDAHRMRSLSPDRPVLRGSAQNPDVFFQAREASNLFHNAMPGIVAKGMDEFAGLTGRRYCLFEFVGAPNAERAIVLMGSGAGAVEEAVESLVRRGEKVGLLKVRLFRPFSAEAFVAALPPTVRRLAVLDRTKEPGALGEPLYQDVVTALSEAWTQGVESNSLRRGSLPSVIGGRYGLSSKEFTPAMALAVYRELKSDDAKRHFTIGIVDDVTHLSLRWEADEHHEPSEVSRAVFYGLGSDGTVGATKNTVKIIGEETDLFAQGYFVYDSKKSGSVTISHLRFSREPIRSTYLIQRANFVACHHFSLLDRMDVLSIAEPGAIFLLNSPFGPNEVWDCLPAEVQQQLIEKRLRFFVVDGDKVARQAGLEQRISTVLQTCFFALANVLPREQAIDAIKAAVRSTFAKRGETILMRNFAAIDGALHELHEVEVPRDVTSSQRRRELVPPGATDFVKRVTSIIMAGNGDLLPVSAFPPDGTFPTGTARFEKRSIATEIPIWDPDICIECGLCALVCPHAAIRMKVFEPTALRGAPAEFSAIPWSGKDFAGHQMSIQVAPDDCTGCGVCVDVCPARSKEIARHKAIDMMPIGDHLNRERVGFDFFLNIPEIDRSKPAVDTVKGCQLLQPLFEFSGACAGCGETPYLKLLTQLFGDRIVIPFPP
ncbi:MAG TPA: pyruvate:ferredoxin (flavodoxin) oxidoreductase, partial [Planctomycetaceae bacterium]|nr:pyruvate:ferredoxin (flavodoxin) oxidoreductase [Planctomycetaceae bacterium]